MRLPAFVFVLAAVIEWNLTPPSDRVSDLELRYFTNGANNPNTAGI